MRRPHKETDTISSPDTLYVAADHDMLDIPGSGTWSQLSAANRDLTSGPSCPSSLYSNAASISYPFSATVQVNGLGPISDALVGRLRWTNPVVMRDLAILFGEDDNLRYQ